MKLVVFDCDGTLVDSQNIICEAMGRAFKAHGRLPPKRSETLAIVGLSLHQAIGALTGPEDPKIDGLVDAYKAAFHDLRASPDHMEPLFPGAREALDRLAARDDVLLAIATGKSQRGVRIVLGHHGLYDRFVSIQTADDAPSKPHPAMILQACAAVGVSAEDAIMVGDTAFDMEMARAAGTPAIGVSWGYHPVGALNASGASLLIDHFDEIDHALDRLWTLGRIARETA